MTFSQPPQQRSFSPWWARGLIAVGIVAFLVAVMAHAAQSAVLNADYYQGVLKDEDAYERAYAELSRDPALLSSSQDLLGGADIPFVDQIPGLLVQAIPVQLVEQMVDVALEDLIAYLKKHKDLQLTLDITAFVGGAGSPGLNSAIEGLGGLTGGGELPEIEDFQDSIDDIIGGIGKQDRLWPQRDGGVPFGLRGGPGELAGAPVASGQVVPDLRDAKFVREVEIDGETHYVLGPPADVVQKVDDALFAVQLISSNSYWMRPVAIVLFVAALAAVIALSWGDGKAMARRVGIMLLVAGLIGFVGWLIALPLTQNMVIDAAFEGGSVPSQAFDDLGRDVLRRTVMNITPYVWLPSLIVAGIGAALLASSRWLLQERSVA